MILEEVVGYFSELLGMTGDEWEMLDMHGKGRESGKVGVHVDR